MLKWRIAPSQSMEDKPYTVKFTAIDTLGKTHKWTTSIATERLTLKKKQELQINDTLIERFALILFEFNKSTLSSANQQIAKTIRESIKDNSLSLSADIQIKVAIWNITLLCLNLDARKFNDFFNFRMIK